MDMRDKIAEIRHKVLDILEQDTWAVTKSIEITDLFMAIPITRKVKCGCAEKSGFEATFYEDTSELEIHICPHCQDGMVEETLVARKCNDGKDFDDCPQCVRGNCWNVISVCGAHEYIPLTPATLGEHDIKVWTWRKV